MSNAVQNINETSYIQVQAIADATTLSVIHTLRSVLLVHNRVYYSTLSDSDACLTRMPLQVNFASRSPIP